MSTNQRQMKRLRKKIVAADKKDMIVFNPRMIDHLRVDGTPVVEPTDSGTPTTLLLVATSVLQKRERYRVRWHLTACQKQAVLLLFGDSCTLSSANIIIGM